MKKVCFLLVFSVIQCYAMHDGAVYPQNLETRHVFASSEAQTYWESIDRVKQLLQTSSDMKDKSRSYESSEIINLLADLVENIEQNFTAIDNGYYSEDPLFEKVACLQALSEIYTRDMETQLQAIGTEEAKTLEKKLQQLMTMKF